MVPFYLQDSYFPGVSHLLIATEKQYLLSPGETGELLLQEGTGSIWKEPRSLPLPREEFSAVLDENRIPHLVSLAQGNFYHLVVSEKGEAETSALFYRGKSKQCRQFLLAGDRQGTLHLIHPAVDRATERWWLMHHRYTSGTWEEPRAVDSGPGNLENHSALAIDDRDRLHLLYRGNSTGQGGLSYRHFDSETATWSKADIISLSPGAAYPSLAADRAQNLHLLWSDLVEEKHYIQYRFRGGPGWKSRGWTPETAISPAIAEPPFPFFTYQSGELFIAWLENKNLFRYRFSGDRWDLIAEQHFKEPQLLRCCSFSLEGAPLHYWLAVERGEPAAGDLQDALLPAVDYHDLEGDFSRLHRYSGKILDRIGELSTDKERLEEKVRLKSREMLHLSRQNDQQIRLLQKSLEGKDTELHKLQQELAQIVDSLKKKNEQIRQTREAERKRFRSAQQEHNVKISRLENELREKEKIIARLESREREQLALMKQLQKENEALKPTTGAIRRSFKKLREQLFPPKRT